MVPAMIVIAALVAGAIAVLIQTLVAGGPWVARQALAAWLAYSFILWCAFNGIQSFGG